MTPLTKLVIVVWLLVCIYILYSIPLPCQGQCEHGDKGCQVRCNKVKFCPMEDR